MKKIKQINLKEWDVDEEWLKVFKELFPNGADLELAGAVLRQKFLIEFWNWLSYQCSISTDWSFVTQTVHIASRNQVRAGASHSTLLCNSRGTVVGGDECIVKAQDHAHVVVGQNSMVTAGHRTAVAAGLGSVVTFQEETQRKTFIVTPDGLMKPNMFYRWDNKNDLQEVPLKEANALGFLSYYFGV